MKKKYYLILLGVGVVIFVILFFGFMTQESRGKVIVYKSPNCGCCVQHSTYLREQGFDVDIVIEEDMDSIKEKYDIPEEMLSCHTAIFGDYFVEGHVPVEAIDKLLEELPAIDGIALPEMPSGSPGMPGPKLEPWIIYQLIDGDYSQFISI